MATPAQLQCPDCNHPPFSHRSGLASHRRSAHGYIDKEAAARYQLRKKHDAALAKAKAKPGKLRCPECDQTFRFANVLGAHRRIAHGVAGTSASSKYSQRQKSGESTLMCEECGAGPFKRMGLHMTRVHGNSKTTTTQSRSAQNGSNSTGNAHADITDEVAIACSLGEARKEYEALIQHYAQRVGLVSEDFASRLMAVVSGSSKTLRQRYRLPH